VRLPLLLAASAVVCLAQLPPIDSANWAARAIQIEGQVSVLKDSTPWALSIGDTIQVRQMIITGADGHAVFQVSDNSTFEVFPNSQVVFRKNVPNWKDLLDLLVGRVRVHIEHLGGMPNPTRMMTPTAVISVRGTTFDVSVDDDDETTLVEVEEGQVGVEHALFGRGQPRLLSAGESLKVYKNEPLAQSGNKGTILKYALRAIMDAVTIASRPGSISTTGGNNPGTVGQTTKTPPPPPPPPPPPGH
jgi:hypothetical protein